jgi:hypothetical protein
MLIFQERTPNWEFAGRINVDELSELVCVHIGGDIGKIDFLTAGKVLMHGGAGCQDAHLDGFRLCIGIVNGVLPNGIE